MTESRDVYRVVTRGLPGFHIDAVLVLRFMVSVTVSPVSLSARWSTCMKIQAKARPMQVVLRQ